MVINQSNFVSYALDHYVFTNTSTREDFTKDVNTLSRVNRCMREIVEKKNTENMLLMINCIVILFNVFGSVAATRLLHFKVDKTMHRQLKALLIATGRYEGSAEFKGVTPCARFYKLIGQALGNR